MRKHVPKAHPKSNFAQRACAQNDENRKKIIRKCVSSIRSEYPLTVSWVNILKWLVVQSDACPAGNLEL